MCSTPFVATEAPQGVVETEPVDEKGRQWRIGGHGVHDIARVRGSSGIQLVIEGEAILRELFLDEVPSKTDLLQELRAELDQRFPYDREVPSRRSHDGNAESGHVPPEPGGREVANDPVAHDQQIRHRIRLPRGTGWVRRNQIVEAVHLSAVARAKHQRDGWPVVPAADMPITAQARRERRGWRRSAKAKAVAANPGFCRSSFISSPVWRIPTPRRILTETETRYAQVLTGRSTNCTCGTPPPVARSVRPGTPVSRPRRRRGGAGPPAEPAPGVSSLGRRAAAARRGTRRTGDWRTRRHAEPASQAVPCPRSANRLQSAQVVCRFPPRTTPVRAVPRSRFRGSASASATGALQR